MKLALPLSVLFFLFSCQQSEKTAVISPIEFSIEESSYFDLLKDGKQLVAVGYTADANGENFKIQINDTSISYGPEYRDRAQAVLKAEGGGYWILGTSWKKGPGRDDIYLLKTDATGNFEKEFAYGHWKHDEIAFNIKKSLDGGFLICGQTFSYAKNGEAYIVKIDKDGKLLWQTNFGSEYPDYALDLVELSDSSIVVLVSRSEDILRVFSSTQEEHAGFSLHKLNKEGQELGKQKLVSNAHDLFVRKLLALKDTVLVFGSEQAEPLSPVVFYVNPFLDVFNQNSIPTEVPVMIADALMTDGKVIMVGNVEAPKRLWLFNANNSNPTKMVDVSLDHVNTMEFLNKTQIIVAGYKLESGNKVAAIDTLSLVF